MNGKERRNLRAIGHSLKPCINLGKKGLTKQLEREIKAQLSDQELIKIKILDTCPLSKKECADKLSEDPEIEVVQIIGRNILLYFHNLDDSNKIQLVRNSMNNASLI